MNFRAVTPSYDCSEVVRDPSIMKFSGVYYLIHTDSCDADAPGYEIAWSHSTDGAAWANHTTLNLSVDVPTATNAWAPEWFQDPQASGLSSVHVFLAITSDVCCSSGFAIYEKHPTAADFSTWSTAQAITIDGYSNLNPDRPFCGLRGRLL